jgi:hypothetical protein
LDNGQPDCTINVSLFIQARKVLVIDEEFQTQLGDKSPIAQVVASVLLSNVS